MLTLLFYRFVATATSLLFTHLPVAQAIPNSSGTYTSVAIYNPGQAGYSTSSGSPYVPEKGVAQGLVTVAGGGRSKKKLPHEP
ncbi:hypothetical protein [Fibrella arboris]|uniref:hypothetical protein n=1 Tax=Fibrella arboris TaxID=3242486 RepID=UPI003522A272